jgi:hypothetical protein
MKKVIMAAIAVASLCLSNAASAADVVITTGQQGLTYNAVCKHPASVPCTF